MIGPIEKMIELVRSIEEPERQNAIRMACFALGHQRRRTGVEMGPDVTIGELLEPTTMEGLEARLRQLIDEVGLLEQLLIPGVLNFLVQYYESLSSPSGLSNAIDLNLDMLERLKGEWGSEDCDAPSEASRQDLIKRTEGALAGLPARGKVAEHVASQLQKVLSGELNDEYWREWALKNVSSRGEGRH